MDNYIIAHIKGRAQSFLFLAFYGIIKLLHILRYIKYMPIIKNFKHKIELGNKLSKETPKEAEIEVEKKGVQVEKSREQGFESARAEEAPGVDAEEQTGGQEVGGFAAAQSAIKKRKERKKRIEDILAKNMEEIYLNMTPAKQEEFKIAGEQAAREINGLLEKTKVKVNKVIDLIKKWLSVIPGVNKFFLEQESKIKADEIIKIKK